MAEKENKPEKENKGLSYRDRELYWGVKVYVIDDADGVIAYDLVGIDLRPGHIKYQLCRPGMLPFKVYDWQATLVKPLDLPSKDDGEE
jgi:hypothetical protein